MSVQRLVRTLGVLMCLIMVAGCGDDSSNSTNTADVVEDTAGSPDIGGSPDVAPEPEPEPEPGCNQLLQDCVAGENCTFVGQDDEEAECIPSGSKAYGEACGGTQECLFGICLQISGTEARCYKFCKTKGHCSSGVQCLDLTDAPYKVCEISGLYTSCNLLADNCTEAGKACYLHGNEGPVCLPAGSEDTGGVCETSTDCAPGNMCINLRCVAVCNANDPEPCGDPFTPCVPQYGAAGYCDK